MAKPKILSRTEILLKYEELLSYMLVNRPLQGFVADDIRNQAAKVKADLDSGKTTEEMLEELLRRERLIALVISNRGRMGYKQNEIQAKVIQTVQELGGVINGKSSRS